MEQAQPGAELPGEGHAVADGGLGRLTQVGGDEDAFEHGVAPCDWAVMARGGQRCDVPARYGEATSFIVIVRQVAWAVLDIRQQHPGIRVQPPDIMPP